MRVRAGGWWWWRWWRARGGGGAQGGAMMLVGVGLLFVSLSFDGATGAYEDQIMSTAHVGPFELMYNIQLGKCILAALSLIFLNEVNYFFQVGEVAPRRSVAWRRRRRASSSLVVVARRCGVARASGTGDWSLPLSFVTASVFVADTSSSRCSDGGVRRRRQSRSLGSSPDDAHARPFRTAPPGASVASRARDDARVRRRTSRRCASRRGRCS